MFSWRIENNTLYFWINKKRPYLMLCTLPIKVVGQVDNCGSNTIVAIIRIFFFSAKTYLVGTTP